ncbi:MAG: hypothetical protein VZS44_09415 [Bacilli bacterium]|nr:hypothetical protein [Bacilli bacterium]
MKKHKLFKINDTYYMSNLEPIYEEDIIKLVDERDKYKEVLNKIKEYVKNDYNRNEEVIDYCGFDTFYNHILELLEEIE